MTRMRVAVADVAAMSPAAACGGCWAALGHGRGLGFPPTDRGAQLDDLDWLGLRRRLFRYGTQDCPGLAARTVRRIERL